MAYPNRYKPGGKKPEGSGRKKGTPDKIRSEVKDKIEASGYDPIEAMIEIAGKAKTDPDGLKAAPVTTPIGRLDETKAARDLNIASL